MSTPGQFWTPDLSVVIPAFNERNRLPRTLAAVDRYVTAHGRATEIVVVDDGSNDGTGAAARAFPAASARVRVLSNPGNRGKGYSVRNGILAADGRRLLFTDADLSAPIEEIEKLEAALAAGADIAIGSRRRELIGTRQSRGREQSGRVFNWVVNRFLGLRFHDTQCGFKLFRREAATDIFPLLTVERWGFDPELLYLARLQGWRVAEVPVAWSHTEGAKIRLLRDGARMFADICRVRWNALRGRYRRAADHRSAAAD